MSRSSAAREDRGEAIREAHARRFEAQESSALDRARAMLEREEREAPSPTGSAAMVRYRMKGPKRAVARLGVLQLRKAGHSYDAICKAMGLPSAAVVRTLLVEALTELDDLTLAEAQHVRTLELARLDSWEERLQGRIDKGEPKAVEVALQVQGRRLALQGLPIGRDAPQGAKGPKAGEDEASKVAPTGHAVIAYAELRHGVAAVQGSDLEALRQQLAKAIGPGVVALQAPQQQATIDALPMPMIEAQAPASDAPQQAEQGMGEVTP